MVDTLVDEVDDADKGCPIVVEAVVDDAKPVEDDEPVLDDVLLAEPVEDDALGLDDVVLREAVDVADKLVAEEIMPDAVTDVGDELVLEEVVVSELEEVETELVLEVLVLDVLADVRVADLRTENVVLDELDWLEEVEDDIVLEDVLLDELNLADADLTPEDVVQEVSQVLEDVRLFEIGAAETEDVEGDRVLGVDTEDVWLKGAVEVEVDNWTLVADLAAVWIVEHEL